MAEQEAFAAEDHREWERLVVGNVQLFSQNVRLSHQPFLFLDVRSLTAPFVLPKTRTLIFSQTSLDYWIAESRTDSVDLKVADCFCNDACCFVEGIIVGLDSLFCCVDCNLVFDDGALSTVNFC